MAASRRKPPDWALPALEEFEAGLACICRDSPAAARLVQTRIEKACDLIAAHPGIGTPGLARGTRHYSVSRTRYTLIYEEHSGGVLIMHCWHQSRDAPE